jgi:hypothetical protein
MNKQRIKYEQGQVKQKRTEIALASLLFTRNKSASARIYRYSGIRYRG